MSGLEHTRTCQLHETNGHFMDIRFLFHIDHTVQVIQITLPTSVQISQAAPIAVQQGVCSSGHIAFVELTIIMYRLIDGPMIIHFLFRRCPLKHTVPENSSFDMGGILHGYRPGIKGGRCHRNGTVRRVADFRRVFLGIQNDFYLFLHRIDQHGHLKFVRKSKSVDTHSMQFGNMIIHPGLEIFPCPQLLRRPSDLGHGKGTREHHIFQMFGCLDIFGPGIGLHPQNMPAFLCRQRIRRDGIIAIHFLYRRIAADGIRLCLRIGLIEIQIHIIARCHHHIMPHPCRFDSTVFSPP